MIKRFLALLAALLLPLAACAGEASSSDAIVLYTLAPGAEALPLWEAAAWQPPEGLEQMYALMQNARSYGDVYLVRMPSGRALASVSWMETQKPCSAKELLRLWPQIAQNIAQKGVMVDDSQSCARMQTLYGFDALCIQTTIDSVGPGAPRLNAVGIAFSLDTLLVELWTLAPEQQTYAPQEQAAQELAGDLAAMEAFMRSLSFPGEQPAVMEGVPYADPDGRFSLTLPRGCTVITPSSASGEVERAREAYVAAHEAGADALFSEYLNDVRTQNVTLILAPDQQTAVEIFASQEESFRDVTVERLLMLAKPICQTLAQKFDAAYLLSGSEETQISGIGHSWLIYWLRSGEADAQLDVLAAVLDDAWLYEVDVFTHNGNQEQRTLWHTYLTQTLRYTPLVNALDE